MESHNAEELLCTNVPLNHEQKPGKEKDYAYNSGSNIVWNGAGGTRGHHFDLERDSVCAAAVGSTTLSPTPVPGSMDRRPPDDAIQANGHYTRSSRTRGTTCVPYSSILVMRA